MSYTPASYLLDPVHMTGNIPISKLNNGSSASGTTFWCGDGTWKVISGSSATWGAISGTLSAQTDLDTALAGKQPLDGDLTAIAALSGTSGLARKTSANTWNLDTSTYLTSNQTITLSGDAGGSGTTAITLTVTKINGTALSGLATGILKNTTLTGVPSIAIASDFPTLNQNTTGTAVNVTGIVASGNGGTGINNGGRTLAVNTNSGTISFTNTATTLTVANTASVSGTNTGDQTTVTGNAGTATALATGRTFTISTDGSGTSGSFDGTGNITIPLTIAAGVVTLAKQANLSPNSIQGNNTGVSATPLALSGTQVTAMLDIFNSTTKGLVPVSGGGTTNFLRADGSWAAAGGGTGTVTSVTITQPFAGIIVTNTGVAQTPAATSTIGLANDLAAVEGLSTTGIVRRTATDTWSAGAAVGLTTEVTGTLPVGNGGSGLATTPTNGQLLIGNGTNYTLATLTAGTGITVTNGAGTIAIAQTAETAANIGEQTFQRLSSNYTNATVTATNIFTGITTVANAIYQVEFMGTTQCSSTGGNKFQLTAPTGATVEGWCYGTGAAVLTKVEQRITAINTLTATAMNTIATTPAPININVIVVCGVTTGTLTIGGADVTSTQINTVFTNSSLRITRLA